MNNHKKYDLSIVGTVGIPAAYGGFETLAEQLTRRMSGRRSIQVFCTGRRQPDPRARLKSASGADLNYVEWDANGWQSIPYDFVSLWRAAGDTRTILVLGVSGCMLLPLLRMLWPKTRIVTNVDGLEWKRQKWGRIARTVLRVSEWFAVNFSHAVIADNQGILEHIASTYQRSSYLIAYGGDQSPPKSSVIPMLENEPASDTRFNAGSYFFGVCRIESENNIAEILRAFSETPEAHLVMVGNWQISEYARQLHARYRDVPNIELLDPIYCQSRLLALRTNAKAYIHGHSAGGTNPSLVEAMHAGMAVIAFDVAYNRHTTHDQAIYWRDSSALADVMRMTAGPILKDIARRMAAIARERYTWHTVTQQYEAILFPEH